MKILFFRLGVLILFVLLQVSFFDILFPWFKAPLFLLMAVAVFTLVRGFPSALFMTVPLTLMFDIASLGAVSWFSLYAVVFSYGTSFLSRRLLIDHQGLGLLLYACISYGGVIAYQAIFSFVVYQNASDAPLPLTLLISSGSIIFSLLCAIPFFVGTYFIIKRFENYLTLQSQRQFLNIR